MQANSILTGADIHPHCNLGGGLLIPHPVALTCSGSAGENFTMMPLCGIGMLPRAADVGAGPGLPLLGDDVWMGPGSGVLGPVRIGSGTRIGPGAGATHDLPAGSIVGVGPPLRCSIEPIRRESPVPQATSRRACRHGSWRRTRQALRADIDRHLRERGVGPSGRMRRLGALLSQELLAIALHRVAHFLHSRAWIRSAAMITHLNCLVFRVTISPGACIGDGVFMPHPCGVVFHGDAGTELTMYARTLCVAVGQATGTARDDGPCIGDRVVFSGMSAVFGAVTIGDDVRLSFNVQVENDAPNGTSVASRVRFHPMQPAPPAGTSSDARHATDASDGTGASQRHEQEPLSFAKTRRLIAEDHRALERLCAAVPAASSLPAARWCATLFRLSNHFQRHHCYRLAWWLWRLNVSITGADIDPRSWIGGGMAIPHPAGISIHVTAGRNMTVRALATLGAETALADDPWAITGRPVVGDDVEICAHASVHGPVRVGSGSRLGPGCRCTADVEPFARLEAPPPRCIAGSVGRLRVSGTASVTASAGSA